MSNPYLTKVFHFNAAHQYGHSDWTDEKNWEVFGPDSKIHGHNYMLEVMVTGDIVDDTGFLVDLGNLKKIVKKNVIDILDHSLFNVEVKFFKDNPSATNRFSCFLVAEANFL